MNASDSLSRFYKYLTDGKTSSLRKLFSGMPEMDTPLSGYLNGEDGLNTLMENEGSWMRRHLISVEMKALLTDRKRTAVELELLVKINGKKVDLPVVLIGETRGGVFDRIRIYHSTLPIHGDYKYREMIVHPDSEQGHPEIVNQYLDGMIKGDIKTLTALFSEEVILQEPRGTEYIHRGIRSCERFFSDLMSDGPPVISHAVSLQDGQYICMEFTCKSWGKKHMNPLSGCTVLRLDEEKEKIESLRFYCDIKTAKS